MYHILLQRSNICVENVSSTERNSVGVQSYYINDKLLMNNKWWMTCDWWNPWQTIRLLILSKLRWLSEVEAKAKANSTENHNVLIIYFTFFEKKSQGIVYCLKNHTFVKPQPWKLNLFQYMRKTKPVDSLHTHTHK